MKDWKIIGNDTCVNRSYYTEIIKTWIRLKV